MVHKELVLRNILLGYMKALGRLIFFTERACFRLW